MEIKDIIRKRREELNLTYEQLGNMVGVGKSTVRKWETGMIENMRRDNIIALSKALNISPSVIMGWEDETENSESDLNYLKIENDLKEIILNKYNSIKEFCMQNDIPYSNVDKIFKKGIRNIDIQLVFKICTILNIDIDSMIDGKVCFNNELLKYTKQPTILNKEESTLLVNYNKLNETGKDEALKRVEELTEITKYTKEEMCASEENKDYLMPIAAHDDDLTDEEKEEMNRKIDEILKKRNHK